MKSILAIVAMAAMLSPANSGDVSLPHVVAYVAFYYEKCDQSPSTIAILRKLEPLIKSVSADKEQHDEMVNYGADLFHMSANDQKELCSTLKPKMDKFWEEFK